MTDRHAQIAALRALRATTTDAAQTAALDAAIAHLERAEPSAAPPPSADQRTIATSGGDYAESTIDKRQGTFSDTLIQLFFHAAGTPNPSADQRALLISYLEGLIARCERLRVAGIVDWERTHGTTPRITLSHVYVAHATTAWQTVAEAATAHTFADALAAGDPDRVLPWDARRLIETRQLTTTDQPTPAHYRLERPILITEALSRRRQIVLLGGPGSGKSTVLRYLALVLARAQTHDLTITNLPGWDIGLALPLLASLGAYAAWAIDHDGLTLDGLWRFLLTHNENILLDGLAPHINAAFRARRLLLLLDGLDEIADPTLRERIAAIIARLCDTQGIVIVTCRVRSFVGAVAAPFTAWGPAIHLAPFTLGQMRHFIQSWYQRSVAQQEINPTQAQQRADELIARINSLKNLRDLAETPLLLTLITMLHSYEGTLPDDRADLYEAMTQLFLTRWTAHRREMGAAPNLLAQLRTQEPRLSGLSDYQIRSVLESLAYRAHQATRTPDGRGLLERGIVREAFLNLFGTFNLDDGAAGTCAALVLRTLEEESGLLVHEGNDLYGLPHLTYQEYLTACHLAKQKGKPEFRTLAYQHWYTDPGRWREVIFLALGRMVRGDDRDIAASWLDFLLLDAHGTRPRDPHERHRATLFAGDCLREIGGQAKLSAATIIDLAHLWHRLAHRLAETLTGPHLPASERIRAGIHLSAIGDPRPGICDLAHLPFIPFSATHYHLGTTPDEYHDIIAAAQHNNLSSETYDWYTDTINHAPIPIAAFELARYPLTNAHYATFIDAGGYDPHQPWWDTAARAWLARDDAATAGLEPWQQRIRKDQPAFWDDERFGRTLPNHPVVGISWYEATAFARWLTTHLNDGYIYSLPSEQEWEYAARGATRRTYAWGNADPNDELVNFNELHQGTSAVGCFPAGATPEGLHDITGNVWEWTRSAYHPYSATAADEREARDDATNNRRILRGGGWRTNPIRLRAAYRNDNTPDGRTARWGMRLARHKPHNNKRD